MYTYPTDNPGQEDYGCDESERRKKKLKLTFSDTRYLNRVVIKLVGGTEIEKDGNRVAKLNVETLIWSRSRESSETFDLFHRHEFLL